MKDSRIVSFFGIGLNQVSCYVGRIDCIKVAFFGGYFQFPIFETADLNVVLAVGLRF